MSVSERLTDATQSVSRALPVVTRLQAIRDINELDEARCVVTDYAADIDGNLLIRTWPGGGGLRAAVVSVVPSSTDADQALVLAAELTGLSAALWRCYTHPEGAVTSVKEDSEGWRRQVERESFREVVENLLNPNFPDEDGMLLVSYDAVEEYAHRAGRALHAIDDPGLTDAVCTDVAAEIDAVEMAERGNLTGRALQAAVLSRAGANPLHVSTADAVLCGDPLAGELLLKDFDPTAASVAAAHWLKAAVDTVADVSGMDAGDVLPAADNLEALPLESPAEVLSLLDFSSTVYAVVVEMVADALLVAEGIVADLDAVLNQRNVEGAGESDDSDEPTAVRVTLLDPSRPALDLLEDLVSAIRGCRLLFEEYVDGETAYVDAQFRAAVRLQAEMHSKRLM